MATNKQRRDAERLRLQRQLEQRRQREVARKRFTLIASIVGTLVVIAAVVVGIIAFTGNKSGTQAGGNPTQSGTSAPSGTATPSGTSTPEKAADCTAAAKLAGAVNFQGVTVNNATNLKTEPKVCSAGTAEPAKLLYKDLVVGKGATPALTSTVSVQYTGVLYRKGTQFDSSWANGGKPISFSLQRVVPGFTQGIGGNPAAKIPPMKVGGRRIVVLPSALGYGPTGSGSTIPPNTSLVFVIDLVKVG